MHNDPDPIPQAYFLEVSSPGAERPVKKRGRIKSSDWFICTLIVLSNIEGEKFLEGTLLSVDEETEH